MPLMALGKLTVTTPGTPVAVSSIIPAAQWSAVNGPYKGHGIMCQALRANSGDVYIGDPTINKTTLVGTLAVLAPASDNFIPSFSAALTIAPNSIVMSDIWIDADQAGDGVLVSLLVS